MLAQRYANPYLILDDFIRQRQLHEFTGEIMKTITEEKIHDARWQFYLHKIYNMSFDDYVAQCENRVNSREETMSHEQIGNVIEDSRKMLEGFIPE